MLFNSFQFLIFFPTVILIYFLLPYRIRWIVLLISSYYFYMAWRPVYIVLIIFSTLVDYFVALKIGQTHDKRKKKKYLAFSLGTNLGVLFFFKYLVFFNESFSQLFNFLQWEYPLSTELNILLPMGISFYTFQTMSYTIDVYRGHIQPEKHLGIFALYVSFFPQLVAGPIERSERLLPQFYKKHPWEFNRIVLGLKLMLMGFFKKIVIADRIAIAVDTVYNQPYNYGGLYFVVTTLLFAIQIFCDFSGYSDIAIGAAKVLGIELMTNFKRPYLAKNIKDFWSRWHISLTSWFRDYVYIPLGGNRISVPRTYMNMMIVFLISGLWHGANWTFVIWGALHGLYQLIGRLTKPYKELWMKRVRINHFSYPIAFFQTIITFILVCFAWIFFRANSMSEAFYIVTHLFDGFSNWFDLGYIYDTVTTLGLGIGELIIVAFAIVLLVIIEIVQEKISIYERLKNCPLILSWGFYYMLLILVITMGVYYHGSEFIYFQF